MPYKLELHEITCPKCNKVYTVQTQAFKRKQKDLKYGMLCSSCRAKVLWEEMSNEQKQMMQEKSHTALKNKYSNMSEEEKHRLLQKRIEGVKKYFNNLTDKEREKMSKERSNRTKVYRNSLTKEQIKDISSKAIATRKANYQTLSDEEKELAFKHRSEISKNTWNNYSEDEKIRRTLQLSESSQNYWNRLNDDERKNHLEKMYKGREKYYKTMSEEMLKEKMGKVTKAHDEWWSSLSNEEKIRRNNENKDRMIEYWSDPELRERRSIESRKNWYNLPEDKRDEILGLMWGARQEKWDSLNQEERLDAMQNCIAASKEYRKNMTPEEYDKLIKKISDAGVTRWAKLSEEDKKEALKPLRNGFRNWWNNLSEDKKLEYSNNMRERILEYWERPESYFEQSAMAKARWESLSPEIQQRNIKRLKDGLRNRKHITDNDFKRLFDKFNLSNLFELSKEVMFISNNVKHKWDFVIINKETQEVSYLVDLDGDHWHGDDKDYDDIYSNEHMDEKRYLSIPDEIKSIIIPLTKLYDALYIINRCINMTYDEYVNYMFNEYRKIPFPEINYTDYHLTKSFAHLKNISNIEISQTCRVGDRLIFHFHKSIYRDHTKNHVSPIDEWNDDKSLKEMIWRHQIYQTWLNKNKILQGFNCSKVSVFSAALAKLIIHKYLDKYDTIFDPFSGYSGRMLGAISLGKRYIGQDLSDIHIQESINIVDFLRKYKVKCDVSLSCKNVLSSIGEYSCLFTCPPYEDSEVYENVPITNYTCDQWIDECLKRFKCERYVFVVNHTEKYKEYIVDEIVNKSIFGIRKEYIVSLAILSDK